MIAVIGTMKFPAEKMAALLPHVQELVRQTNAHDGCIAYDVGEDILEPGLLRFSELWPDQESLTRHIAAPHIAPWRQACQDHGILNRSFAVYDVTGERSL
ncbi:putative quinol monooxygenase [Sphingobium nicotianae]|uniref:Antibiotic biosynthesis monooxygenase n=1 Tax=Sphingobium nicotianae TaxID=2782607 RepID=A0A9X1DD02_9SPHN|nr:putative quinol monooxygenase [Sphingobium nicotianae]MBT2187672.1 antibiotic biosynthesis monooxygenase [Sphingobium nicotianae]